MGWHALAYSGILWHTLAYFSILLHTHAYSGILLHTLVYSGILWHTLAYSGILWHTLAYSGILWHTLPYYLLCTPCHLNYTVIAKTEDIQGDSRCGSRIIRKKILCISSDIFWKY